MTRHSHFAEGEYLGAYTGHPGDPRYEDSPCDDCDLDCDMAGSDCDCPLAEEEWVDEGEAESVTDD
jgi:hypothetical protein